MPMCGILGLVGSYDANLFKVNLNKMAHRGPDGFGVWTDEDCILGHRRLSIIDTSDRGKQPMKILDRYVITFNGEIFNYLELRETLTKNGYSFISQSDTEVLLYSYLQWGVHCLQKLNGMWAFAIWDKVSKELFLARDRIGEKPLFYLNDSEKFVFSSEMKSLYGYCKSFKLNDELIFNSKNDIFSYETTDECLVKEIKRFPSGSYGIYKNGRLQINKYWNPLEYIKPTSLSYNDQVEYFRELFLDSCKIRMRSDVPLGTALSGGLDSSATICSMSYLNKSKKITDIQHNWQHAFVACFKGSTIDERIHAEKVTNHIGIEATFLEIDPLADIDKLQWYLYLFEELYFTSPIPFIQTYRAVRESGVRVTLDGHGADELFGGYPFSLSPALIDSFPNPTKYSNILKTIESGESRKKGGKEKWELIKFVLANKFSKLRAHPERLNLAPKYNNLDYLNSSLYELSYSSILPTLLRNYDRYSMINGVEIRMPFLDYRILEFAFNIPFDSKIRNGFTKNIIRDALNDLMPHSISYRKDKIGFNSPGGDWITGPLNSWFNDTIHSSAIRNCDYLDDEEKLFLNKFSGKNKISFNDGEKIWSKLLLALWVKSFQYA